MAVPKIARSTAEQQAEELLRQRAERVGFDRRRTELEDRVKLYERRYGMPSSAVHAAIERGELKENQEVCRWIIDNDLLERARAH